MSAPRVKRQFAGAASDPAQRQITAFFSSSSPHAAALSFSPPSSCSSISTAGRRLEPRVKADLLSVGMRVRKAVSEGYKTVAGSGSGGNPPFGARGRTAGAAAALQQQQQEHTHKRPPPQWPPQRRSRMVVMGEYDPATTMTTEGEEEEEEQQQQQQEEKEQDAVQDEAFGAPRELLPFCGLLKVGGLGVQEHSCTTPAHGITAGSDEDEELLSDTLRVPDLVPSGSADSSGSGSSLDSVGSFAFPSRMEGGGGSGGGRQFLGRKRVYEEEEEDEEVDGGEHNAATAACAGGWRSRDCRHHQQQSSAGGVSFASTRQHARPRRRLQEQQQGRLGAVAAGGDFDEAPFLDPGLLQFGGEAMEIE